MNTTPTPMMQQYLEAKRACPGMILLFRMGDFYELFYDDAKEAARILGLAVTSRDKGENGVPMSGFPYHALETHLAKLIAAGQRVAVADQVEDPKQAKGLVRREVTRIVTPGTLTDHALLDERESNYLLAVSPGEPRGLAWVEISTGKFLVGETSKARLADEVARVAPAEIVMAEGDDLGLPPGCTNALVVVRPAWAFQANRAHDVLKEHFRTHTLEGFGFQGEEAGLAAAGAVLDYLKETQRASLIHLDRLTPFSTDDSLQIDESTRRSLEIHRRLRDGDKKGSLLGVLDETTTAMGARLLGEWAAAPLTNVTAIDERLDAVQEFAGDAHWTADVRAILYETYDLQRLLARVATGRASPRDLSFVSRTLQRLPRLKAKLTARKSTLLTRLEGELDLLPELHAELDRALCDDCPLNANEGGYVRDGYSEQLDKLRELAAGGKQWIAEYQAKEIARTGIPNLKVGYNKVFGYYIEITQSQYGKTPPDYIRKQTVKNAERFITPDLKTYEEQVLTAVERSQTLENEIFLQLRERTAFHAPRLQATARAIAEIDVLAGLASLATRRGWTRPRVTDEPVLEIIDGRHPVLDAVLPDGSFVPNDTKLGGEHGLISLITGPNMAGKSTYIRQTALITFLAQVGSFVPAKAAVIGVADRIFARVGASDELSRGQSTFMVEMTETARILHTATPNSLIILDEVGRGTSTYDGVSLAWSIVEHLHNIVGARTLFATHYHELTQLAEELPHMRNFTVAVREWHGEVIFLHKITPGAADKSYGLHVAQLAGVPPEVIARASAILKHLEADHVPAEVRFQPVKRRAKKVSLEGQRLLFFGDEVQPVDGK